ncbi:MAG: M14 family metallocarboxypeptidase [Candidatus Latescibacteria bacterium]|nr:M14 family metallocarboxypeptidase [Candidatus Latescibacterota bacterium]
MDRRDYNDVVRRVDGVGGDVCMLGMVEGFPILSVTLGKKDAPVFYVNGGTHGDEPGGVEALLVFLEGKWERWADRFRFEVIPCLNPWAFVHNSRLNAQEVDINWAFLREDVPEIEIVKRFVEGKFFAGVLDFHEDWESAGYYLYEMFRNSEPLGQAMVTQVADVCPLNENSEIEDEVAINGVIHPNMEVAKRKYGEGIPIALFQRRYTDRLVTAESPTALSLPIRVAAHLAALEVMVEAGGRS